MSVLILYKNAARVGMFVDCKIDISGKHDAISAEEASVRNAECDCLIPFNGAACVIPCKLRLSAETDLPDLYLRTERGEWNFGNPNTVYFLPPEGAVMQIFTKEKSKVSKTPIFLEFVSVNEGFLVARSEPILVLSKPPINNRFYPFARASQTSPSKYAKSDLVPANSSTNIEPWKFQVLGSYRTQKRQRDDDQFEEVRLLKYELRESRAKIEALETEKAGLAKALKLLSCAKT